MRHMKFDKKYRPTAYSNTIRHFLGISVHFFLFSLLIFELFGMFDFSSDNRPTSKSSSSQRTAVEKVKMKTDEQQQQRRQEKID